MKKRGEVIRRFLALFVAAGLWLPHPAWALRGSQTTQSAGLEQEIARELGEPRAGLESDVPPPLFRDAIRIDAWELERAAKGRFSAASAKRRVVPAEGIWFPAGSFRPSERIEIPHGAGNVVLTYRQGGYFDVALPGKPQARPLHPGRTYWVGMSPQVVSSGPGVAIEDLTIPPPTESDRLSEARSLDAQVYLWTRSFGAGSDLFLRPVSTEAEQAVQILEKQALEWAARASRLPKRAEPAPSPARPGVTPAQQRVKVADPTRRSVPTTPLSTRPWHREDTAADEGPGPKASAFEIPDEERWISLDELKTGRGGRLEGGFVGLHMRTAVAVPVKWLGRGGRLTLRVGSQEVTLYGDGDQATGRIRLEQTKRVPESPGPIFQTEELSIRKGWVVGRRPNLEGFREGTVGEFVLSAPKPPLEAARYTPRTGLRVERVSSQRHGDVVVLQNLNNQPVNFVSVADIDRYQLWGDEQRPSPSKTAKRLWQGIAGAVGRLFGARRPAPAPEPAAGAGSAQPALVGASGTGGSSAGTPAYRRHVPSIRKALAPGTAPPDEIAVKKEALAAPGIRDALPPGTEFPAPTVPATAPAEPPVEAPAPVAITVAPEAIVPVGGEAVSATPLGPSVPEVVVTAGPVVQEAPAEEAEEEEIPGAPMDVGRIVERLRSDSALARIQAANELRPAFSKSTPLTPEMTKHAGPLVAALVQTMLEFGKPSSQARRSARLTLERMVGRGSMAPASQEFREAFIAALPSLVRVRRQAPEGPDAERLDHLIGNIRKRIELQVELARLVEILTETGRNGRAGVDQEPGPEPVQGGLEASWLVAGTLEILQRMARQESGFTELSKLRRYSETMPSYHLLPPNGIYLRVEDLRAATEPFLVGAPQLMQVALERREDGSLQVSQTAGREMEGDRLSSVVAPLEEGIPLIVGVAPKAEAIPEGWRTLTLQLGAVGDTLRESVQTASARYLLFHLKQLGEEGAVVTLHPLTSAKVPLPASILTGLSPSGGSRTAAASPPGIRETGMASLDRILPRIKAVQDWSLGGAQPIGERIGFDPGTLVELPPQGLLFPPGSLGPGVPLTVVQGDHPVTLTLTEGGYFRLSAPDLVHGHNLFFGKSYMVAANPNQWQRFAPTAEGIPVGVPSAERKQEVLPLLIYPFLLGEGVTAIVLTHPRVMGAEAADPAGLVKREIQEIQSRLPASARRTGVPDEGSEAVALGELTPGYGKWSRFGILRVPETLLQGNEVLPLRIGLKFYAQIRRNAETGALRFEAAVPAGSGEDAYLYRSPPLEPGQGYRIGREKREGDHLDYETGPSGSGAYVSARHLEIQRESGEALLLRDLGSKNGTFIETAVLLKFQEQLRSEKAAGQAGLEAMRMESLTAEQFRARYGDQLEGLPEEGRQEIERLLASGRLSLTDVALRDTLYLYAKGIKLFEAVVTHIEHQPPPGVRFYTQMLPPATWSDMGLIFIEPGSRLGSHENPRRLPFLPLDPKGIVWLDPRAIVAGILKSRLGIPQSQEIFLELFRDAEGTTHALIFV